MTHSHYIPTTSALEPAPRTARGPNTGPMLPSTRCGNVAASLRGCLRTVTIRFRGHVDQPASGTVGLAEGQPEAAQRACQSRTRSKSRAILAFNRFWPSRGMSGTPGEETRHRQRGPSPDKGASEAPCRSEGAGPRLKREGGAGVGLTAVLCEPHSRELGGHQADLAVVPGHDFLFRDNPVVDARGRVMLLRPLGHIGGGLPEGAVLLGQGFAEPLDLPLIRE